MITPVAVGILHRAGGDVLLAQRPQGKPYAGWWEFPGGKCEPGESSDQALARELFEELGVTITEQRPWLVQDFVYPHATVQLQFHWVTQWHGEPHAKEGQALAWCDPKSISLEPLLPASIEVIRWLSWPLFVPLNELGQSNVNSNTCQLIDAPISQDELFKQCRQTRKPIYVLTSNQHYGGAGYLSSLVR